MILAVVLACAVSAAVSYLSARFVVIPFLQRHGVLDHPTARSSHDKPVARGGGIAVFAGLMAGTAVAVLTHVLADQQSEWNADVLRAFLPIVAGCLFGLVGLVDDLNSLSAISRLVTQVVLAIAFAAVVLATTGVGVFAAAAVALSIIIVVNGTNFMDGLNSLVSVWGAGTALWFGALALSVDSPLLAASAVALAAALMGFLPLNVSPARSFLGDVGSYAIGGFLSVAIWVLWSDGVQITALFAPFVIPVFDVLFTLGKRIYRGENLFTAHRTHIYQKMQTAGLSHEQVSATHLIATVLCIGAVLPVATGVAVDSPLIASVVWAVVIVVYVGLPAFISRRGKRKHA